MPRFLAADSLAPTTRLAGLCIGLPVLATLLRGLDSNWDLRNYHLYGPHALLHGRTAIDIGVAQIQGFHNPLLDLPMYLLVASGAPPLLAALWLTIPAILSLALLLRLQRVLSPVPAAEPTMVSRVVLVLLAIGGAATWSTLASSMDDAFVGAGVLLSLWLILDQPQPASATRRWFVAGIVAGATAGLKLSAAFYCVALGVAAIPGGGWRERCGRLALLASGGAIGFALAYGWWAWRLEATHGNPVFPYFNDLFQSRDAEFRDYADARFRPASWADALLAPVHLLQKSQLFSELKLRDPRLFLGLLSFTTLFLLDRRDGTAAAASRHRTTVLGVFFASAFLLWVHQFGIYRYAVALELLGCLALVALLSRLPAWRAPALCLALLLVNADTRRPDWGRDAQPLPRAGIARPALGAGALVVTASGDPLAYLALGLPDDVPMIGLSNNLMSPDQCTGLQIRANLRVAAQRGPLWLLVDPSRPDAARAQALLASRYGLVSTGECQAWQNALGAAQLCRQRRIGPPRQHVCAG